MRIATPANSKACSAARGAPRNPCARSSHIRRPPDRQPVTAMQAATRRSEVGGQAASLGTIDRAPSQPFRRATSVHSQGTCHDMTSHRVLERLVAADRRASCARRGPATPTAVSDDDLHQAYSAGGSAADPRDEFQQAAAEAYDRLSPEERSRIAHHLRIRGRAIAICPIPSASRPARQPRWMPGALATATADMNDQQPNLLQELFAPGGTFSSPLAKAALLGITAFAAQRLSKPLRRSSAPVPGGRVPLVRAGVVDASAANPDNLTRN